MHTKHEIELCIRDTIVKVTGVTELLGEDSLIDKNVGIMPVNFLYIFDILEKQLELPICNIFKTNSYDVMCINNLTDAIYKLQ